MTDDLQSLAASISRAHAEQALADSAEYWKRLQEASQQDNLKLAERVRKAEECIQAMIGAEGMDGVRNAYAEWKEEKAKEGRE